jgi:hypothetical protein
MRLYFSGGKEFSERRVGQCGALVVRQPNKALLIVGKVSLNAFGGVSVPSPLPLGFILPCLSQRLPKPPSGSAWMHEIKHDGYRLIARRDGKRIRFIVSKRRDSHYRSLFKVGGRDR